MNYLSIDVGGTEIKTAIMDHSGNILSKKSYSTPKDDLHEFCKTIIEIVIPYQHEVKGIAICVPGKINPETGTIIIGGSLKYLNNFGLKQFVEDRFGIYTSVENDAKAATLSELWLGNLKEKKDGVVLVLGTAVGCGILIDGNILRGKNFQAGEISYQLTITTGERTYQGRNLSAVRMIENLAQKLELSDLKDGIQVFEYLEKRDSRIFDTFKEYCRNIAILINNLQVTLDIDLFVISGGISRQELLITNIEDELKKLRTEYELLETAFNSPKVVASKTFNDANLYGALYHLFMSLEKE